MARVPTKEELLEDDAHSGWVEYLSEHSDTYHVFPEAYNPKKAFIAGYLMGRKDERDG